MSGKKKIVNQDSMENYGKEAAKGATSISKGDDEFDRADDEFEEARAEENMFNAACTEESAARACSQRLVNLDMYAMGKANKRKEDKTEDNAARNCTQLERKPVEKATGEVENIFGGGTSLGNESAPLSAPTHAGDSWGRCREDYTTGKDVEGGGKCTHGRDNSAEPTQGADGRNSHAT